MTLRQRRALSPRRILGRLWLRAFGWTLDERLPGVDRAVLVAAQHTSNWDLPFALAVAWYSACGCGGWATHALRPPLSGG
jgi:1-acyl-sn-glycerol-3-phosphate acyltransferase